MRTLKFDFFRFVYGVSGRRVHKKRVTARIYVQKHCEVNVKLNREIREKHRERCFSRFSSFP